MPVIHPDAVGSGLKGGAGEEVAAPNAKGSMNPPTWAFVGRTGTWLLKVRRCATFGVPTYSGVDSNTVIDLFFASMGKAHSGPTSEAAMIIYGLGFRGRSHRSSLWVLLVTSCGFRRWISSRLSSFQVQKEPHGIPAGSRKTFETALYCSTSLSCPWYMRLRISPR